MSKKIKTSGGVTVHVDGIRYEEFAKVKWQQFMKIYSVVLVLILAAILGSQAVGKMPEKVPVSGAVAVLLILLAMLAVFRSAIRNEYKKNKLSALSLTYYFDRDGWTVQQGSHKNTVAWKSTLKLRKNQNALLIYPNKKSVNLVPLRCISASDLEKVIGFCTGKK